MVWCLKVVAVAAALTLSFGSFTARASTLEEVKGRGTLKCGVDQGLPGFSYPDANGHWTGFDVDICRAVAAAVLGDSQKIQFVPLNGTERLSALQSGEVDVLSRTTTQTLLRDTVLGLNWAGINYYDGQSFMVRKELNIQNAKQLDGATVCLTTGTTTELNLSDYFRKYNLRYRPVVFEQTGDAWSNYENGKCDAISSDQSVLASVRLTLKNPDAHIILSDVISKEPLGPVVRHGDDQWLDIVRWSFNAMLEAEENGITQNNIDGLGNSTVPFIRRFLGQEGGMGEKLGLDNEWAYRIIKQVGNYGESFERNIGSGSPLKLPRGLNNLWKNGGIQYAPPIR